LSKKKIKIGNTEAVESKADKAEVYRIKRRKKKKKMP